MENNLMTKKLLELIKKNCLNNPNSTLTKDTYGSVVNSKILSKYKYGEEHAIIRKAIYQLLQDLTKYGVDISKYSEFIEYYNYAEEQKAKNKTNE